MTHVVFLVSLRFPEILSWFSNEIGPQRFLKIIVTPPATCSPIVHLFLYNILDVGEGTKVLKKKKKKKDNFC